MIWTTYNNAGENANQFVLDSDGYIGLGTTSSTAMLDIGGGSADNIDGTDDLLVKDDAEIDGNLYVDGLITSGGVGVVLSCLADDITVTRTGTKIVSLTDGSTTWTPTYTGDYPSSYTDGTNTITIARGGENEITSWTVAP